MAHGLSHGATGALVSAWPALALVGSFELLMTLTRNTTSAVREAASRAEADATPEETAPDRTELVHTPEEAVLTDYLASLEGPGRPLSQRFLAEKHGVDRRKVREIISTMTQPAPM